MYPGSRAKDYSLFTMHLFLYKVYYPVKPYLLYNPNIHQINSLCLLRAVSAEGYSSIYPQQQTCGKSKIFTCRLSGRDHMPDYNLPFAEILKIFNFLFCNISLEKEVGEIITWIKSAFQFLSFTCHPATDHERRCRILSFILNPCIQPCSHILFPFSSIKVSVRGKLPQQTQGL